MRAHTLLLPAMILAAVTADAQPLARADLTGVVGWFHANKPDAPSYNDWYHHSAYGGIALGWYWTDHLKSELDVGATSAAELFIGQTIAIDGRSGYANTRHRFNTRRATVGQQYQFLRNTWVHPHVAGGVDVTREREQQHDDPVVVYDQVTRTTLELRPARTREPTTALKVRPFAELGTKLYLSRRGFFRTDLRLTFTGGVDEVLLRFGVGVDF